MERAVDIETTGINERVFKSLVTVKGGWMVSKKNKKGEKKRLRKAVEEAVQQGFNTINTDGDSNGKPAAEPWEFVWKSFEQMRGEIHDSIRRHQDRISNALRQRDAEPKPT